MTQVQKPHVKLFKKDCIRKMFSTKFVLVLLMKDKGISLKMLDSKMVSQIVFFGI